MTRELNWLEPQNAQASYPDAGRVGDLTSDSKPHLGPLEHAFRLEQADEERRISIAGAFIMFMFGFGCGVFWTIVLTWLF